MTDQLFTIEQIKEAFWHEFHKSGEIWFNYLGTEEENEDSTRCKWEYLVEILQKGANNDSR